MEISNRQTILASITLTLCLVSDSLLYLLLPLYFDDFGLAFIWVGILLSANRLIRILLQTWLITWYEKLGVQNTMLMSVVLAGIACSFFTLSLSVYWLLLARFMWGIAYALMRMCCLFLATDDSKSSLTKLGWYSSLQEVGPLTVLIFTPWLSQFMHPKLIMVIPLVLCFIAVIPALMLKPGQSLSRRKNAIGKSHKFLPEWNNDHAITLMLSLLYDGVWVIALAPLLILTGLTQDSTLTIVAVLFILRRAFNFVLGLYFIKSKSSLPIRNLVKLSMFCMVTAGFLIFFDQIALGSIVAIAGRGFYMLLMPRVLSDEKDTGTEKIHAVNAFTVSRDVATATGAFIAGVLLYLEITQSFFLIITLFIIVVSMRQYGILKNCLGKFIFKVRAEEILRGH